MHRYLAVALTVVLLLAGGLSPIAAPTARAETTVKVSINDPHDGETISEPRDVIFVGGHAYARGEEAPAFDIAILIDTSGSTSKSAGVDVNGNGIVGLTSRPTAVISVFDVETRDLVVQRLEALGFFRKIFIGEAAHALSL